MTGRPEDEIDEAIRDLGESLDRGNPPPAGAREQLAQRMGGGRRRTGPWLPAAAAAIAAAVALAVMGPAPAGQRGRPKEAGFIGIPYAAPLDPREHVSVVRMDIKVASLIAVGYRVAADPEAVVLADVLLGEDGRAHAVRVLAEIEVYGTGD